MDTRKIDLYDYLNSDEVKQITDIFIGALARKEGVTPEALEERIKGLNPLIRFLLRIIEENV